MKILLVCIALMLVSWFLPSTRKVFLERIRKQKAQAILNEQTKREIKKFKSDYATTFKKGEYAEKKLELALKRDLNKKDWHVLHNVTLEIDDGTTQIDLIIVSIYGIFVIEVKEFAGKIYANNGKSWYQYLGGQKFPFQNPHHQNARHIAALQKNLAGIPKELYQSKIVFLGTATFKSLPEETYTSIEKLLESLKGNQQVIKHKDMVKVMGFIEFFRKYDLPETHDEHVKYLQKRHGKELVAE